ncbi:hypothetical protein ACFVFJ_45750 [Streptomyces sp. NPDC057717]
MGTRAVEQIRVRGRQLGRVGEICQQLGPSMPTTPEASVET